MAVSLVNRGHQLRQGCPVELQTAFRYALRRVQCLRSIRRDRNKVRNGFAVPRDYQAFTICDTVEQL